MAQREGGQEQRPISSPSTDRSALHQPGHPGDLHRRHRLRTGLLVGVAGILSLGIMATGTVSHQPTVYKPLPNVYFTRVAGTTAPRTSPTPTVAPSPTEQATPIPSPTPSASPTPHPTPRTTPRPTPRQAPRAIVVPSQPHSTSHKTTVTATWYCLPGTSRCPRGRSGGLYAAISPDLASLRGKRVRACYRGSCVVVKIIDCNCQAHGSIDLFADAFQQLAPLSAGRLRGVTISW